MRIFGVILAGGTGRRMGGVDKALLGLNGTTMVQHVQDRFEPQVERLAISANGDATRLAFTGLPILPVYAAMKAAHLALIRGLAVRYAAHGVTLNNVSPGLVRTERNAWRREPGGDWEAFSRTCSYARRAGEPEEVACAVAMFCAPGASFVTGENLFVAGGAQIPGRRDDGNEGTG